MQKHRPDDAVSSGYVAKDHSSKKTGNKLYQIKMIGSKKQTGCDDREHSSVFFISRCYSPPKNSLLTYRNNKTHVENESGRVCSLSHIIRSGYSCTKLQHCKQSKCSEECRCTHSLAHLKQTGGQVFSVKHIQAKSRKHHDDG